MAEGPRLWLVELRDRRGLSQEALAARLGVDPGTVGRWERGTLGLRRRRLVELSNDFELPLAVIYHCMTTGILDETLGNNPPAGPGRLEPARAGALQATQTVPAPPVVTDYADADQLQAIHDHIRSLVTLDNQFGGADLVQLSVRYFASLRDQIGAGAYDQRLEQDLHAALGELAEVVGWLAYDAEEHDLVRRMNQESLYYTRLAGDRTMELLTLQNASMHAGALGRHAEALHVARSVLEGGYDLSPRVRSLFLVRQARALAQAGDRAALPMFEQARSLYLDGPSDSDPMWAWWIDEREVAWHEAMARKDLLLQSLALEEFEHSVEATGIHEIRSQYLHRAYLLQAQIDVGALDDARTSIAGLLPLIPQVRSTRTVVLLDNALATAAKIRNGHDGAIDEDLTRLQLALVAVRR